jgi:hypothetical protein
MEYELLYGHPDVVGVSVDNEPCIPRSGRMAKELFDGTTSGLQDFAVVTVSEHHVSSARTNSFVLQ